MPSVRRYRIHEAIGRGAFGTVYRATLEGEGGFTKVVAVKILNEKASATPDTVSRLRDEARLLGRVRHRSILQVDGLVQIGSRWALVAEFVEGISLLDALRSGPIPASVVIEMIGEVAGALNVAYHSTNIDGQPLKLVHRDIKPANIQITRHGEVKLLDFGIAHANFDERESETQSMVLGTPGYMAPERFEGHTGPEADIYALAIVALELMMGKRVGRTFVDRQKHVEHVARALGSALQMAPELSPASDVVAQMLQYDPEARPNAKEVERALRTVRLTMTGPWLAEWSDPVVTQLLKVRPRIVDDTLSGAVLAEGSQINNVVGLASSTGTTTKRIAVGVAATAGASVVVVGALALGLALWKVGAFEPRTAAVAAAVVPQDPPAIAAVTLPPAVPLGEVPVEPPIAVDPPPAPAAVVDVPKEKPPDAVKPLGDPRPPDAAKPPVVKSKAGKLVTAGEFARWLADHPDWAPDAARADSRADENYLWGWQGTTPPDAAATAAGVTWAAADAMCRPRGGLAPLDAEPATWSDASGVIQEWRVAEGKPAWQRYDGVASKAVRRSEANMFTAFRCAR